MSGGRVGAEKSALGESRRNILRSSGRGEGGFWRVDPRLRAMQVAREPEAMCSS